MTAAGPLNPKEVADMRATDDDSEARAEASGGRCIGWRTACREIRRVGAGRDRAAANWIGLAQQWRLSRHRAGAAAACCRHWLALLLIVGSLLLAWRIEGR